MTESALGESEKNYLIKNQQLLPWAFIGLALLSWCPLATAQAWKGIPARNLAALKQQAEAGEPAALAEYAHHSLICLGGVEYDQDLILDFFRRSAAMGNLEGQAGLAQAFAFSIGTARNLRKADKLSQQVLTTDKGHPVAQMVRGFLSLGYEGIVPKNEEQAFSLLTQAAKKGNLTAEFHLADAYYHGYSVAKDQVEARSLLRALHKKKTFPNASSQLLRMLREKEGGPKEEELYRECYNAVHQFAELGEPDALHELAWCHFRAGDEESALGYFLRAANRGGADAWSTLTLTREVGPRNWSKGSCFLFTTNYVSVILA